MTSTTYNYVVLPDKPGEKPILLSKENDKQAVRFARKRFDKKCSVFFFTKLADKSTYKRIF